MKHVSVTWQPEPVGVKQRRHQVYISEDQTRFSGFHSIFFSPQRQAKYTENKLKAIKARNEYLLALEATNCCVFKYYIHDLSDLIDVSPPVNHHRCFFKSVT